MLYLFCGLLASPVAVLPRPPTSLQPFSMQQQVQRSLLRACKLNLNVFAVPAAASFSTSTSTDSLKWVFLGPPGVGKGTYASRIAAALNVPHIAAGDLVRAEIKSGSTLGQQVCSMVSSLKAALQNALQDLRVHPQLSATNVSRSYGTKVIPTCAAFCRCSKL